MSLFSLHVKNNLKSFKYHWIAENHSYAYTSFLKEVSKEFAQSKVKLDKYYNPVTSHQVPRIVKFSERQKTSPPPPSPPANALYSRLRITSNATMPIKLRPQALGECQLANFSLGEQSTKSEARSTERSTLFNHDRVPSIAGRFAFIRPRFAVTKGIRVCLSPVRKLVGSL